ncbi:hypothetical protein MTO96_038163 [Rhipicephalus appendiculatus]
MDEESYRFVEGVWLHKIFKEEQFRSAMSYKPRDGDVFVASYPKCGTNWTHFIVYNILTRAKPVVHLAEFRRACPFIDANGSGVAEDPLRTGPIMTHSPLRVLQRASCAKYIYITRNPYDCVVSYYHFLKGITPKTITDISFERFLSLFLAGKLAYGDYFDHLLPWYNLRDEANVLFVTYEQLKADTTGQILRIADFIGSDHGAMLRDDGEILSKVLDSCSVQSMRKIHNDNPEERVMKLSSLSRSTPASRDEDRKATPLQSRQDGAGFVRKAVVGDWKNYFTEELVAQTKAWIENKCKNSAVMEFWADIGLP